MTAQEIRSCTITELVAAWIRKDARHKVELDAPPLTKLQSALLKANIRPLYTDDVRAFQAQRLAEEKAKRRPLLTAAFLLYFSLMCSACFAGLLLVIRGLLVDQRALIAAASIVAGMGALSLIPFLAALAYRCRRSSVTRLLAWRNYTVGFSGAGKCWDLEPTFRGAGLATSTVIPPAALKRARELAATGVCARFTVDQLDTDPFLWVTDEGEDYCIAVWDERGFIL